MSNRFIISDTHFGHENSWAKFKNADGSPLRPFTSTEEMDEEMIARWNAKVTDKDTVYHLGDVVIAKRHLEKVKRLNGRKILIRGNHDIFKDKDFYEVGFEQIHGVRVFVDKWIMSHIPLHPDSVTTRFRVNVHGHLHGNEVMREREVCVDPGINDYYTQIPPRYDTVREIDPRYLCVSVEHTNYEPLSFEEVEARIQARWEAVGYTPPEGAGWGNGSGPG